KEKDESIIVYFSSAEKSACGGKDRYVYVSPEIAAILKSHNWQPNQTNRRDFWDQGDLQPDYNAISGKRYSIVSPELKRKLGEIISQRRTAEGNISSSPAIIEAQLTLDPQQNKASYEIRNKIREASMDLAEVFAAGGEYFDLQPSYYREEKIREFKNEIMNIVERSVGQFNQRRQQVIDQAKQEAQNKGVQREREREERDRQREEELQSKQEERSRETKDNFKFKDAEFDRKKEEIEKKLEDLKKKLDQPENQDQTDNSDYENEKKDLEKKLENNPPPPPSEEPKISTKKAESKLN
ncbi:23346_t:CDS:2, partial [Racocetra persica]